jgi:dTDP-4-dehydrorhamnose 3,5-epimerase-like enzyme
MFSLIPINFYQDNRGGLGVINTQDEYFKDYNRFFFTFNLNLNQTRGNHAHKREYQILFAIQGKFQVTVECSEGSFEIPLHSGSEGLLLPPLHWSAQTCLTENAVLGAFATGEYDSSEYINSISEFRKLIKS